MLLNISTALSTRNDTRESGRLEIFYTVRLPDRFPVESSRILFSGYLVVAESDKFADSISKSLLLSFIHIVVFRISPDETQLKRH